MPPYERFHQISSLCLHNAMNIHPFITINCQFSASSTERFESYSQHLWPKYFQFITRFDDEISNCLLINLSRGRWSSVYELKLPLFVMYFQMMDWWIHFIKQTMWPLGKNTYLCFQSGTIVYMLTKVFKNYFFYRTFCSWISG